MDELILTCPCGHQKRISAYAVGMVENCEGCGRRIQSSGENTSKPPVEMPGPAETVGARETDRAAGAASEPRRPPNACPQCGNAYRGEWDRVETHQGVLCHHCSVLATETAPDLRHLSSPVELDIEKEPQLDSPPKTLSIGPWTVDPESDSFKRWVLAAGLFVVAMTVVLVLTDDYSGPESRGSSASEVKEVPGYLIYVLAVWQLAAFYLTAFFAIYFTLQRELKLPHETFGRNALYIGRALLVVTVILALTAASLYALAPFFVVGRVILQLVAAITGGLFIIWALTKLLDFEIKDFLVLLVFFLLAEILAQAVTTAVWAAVYTAVL